MYKILELNPQLVPFAGDIDLRMFLYRATKGRLLSEGQTLNDFANAHNYYGFHRIEEGWVYGESYSRADKTTPCLVPYGELPENEKDFDRNTALETLKLIVKLGYKISK